MARHKIDVFTAEKLAVFQAASNDLAIAKLPWADAMNLYGDIFFKFAQYAIDYHKSFSEWSERMVGETALPTFSNYEIITIISKLRERKLKDRLEKLKSYYDKKGCVQSSPNTVTPGDYPDEYKIAIHEGFSSDEQGFSNEGVEYIPFSAVTVIMPELGDLFQLVEKLFRFIASVVSQGRFETKLLHTRFKDLPTPEDLDVKISDPWLRQIRTMRSALREINEIIDANLFSGTPSVGPNDLTSLRQTLRSKEQEIVRLRKFIEFQKSKIAKLHRLVSRLVKSKIK